LLNLFIETLIRGKDGDFMQNFRISVWTLLLACSLASILGSIGCNTVRGVGQDIERGGEKTQDAAEAVRRRM
jgi:predicted small secreted protein